METPLSIKFRAPRAFATQNRAVTESDYEHIVSEIYPQAASVTAYGGEKLVPPVYGKVYIAIRPKTGTSFNESTKVGIKQDLLRYSVASIEVSHHRSYNLLHYSKILRLLQRKPNIFRWW